MPLTEQELLAWHAAQYEHNRKINAIRFAIKENRTWSHDHPDSIRNQIRQLNQLLFEAEQGIE
jgi:N-acetyl-anhydromuramyl-L-alanine amidase AmpD